MPDPVWMYRRSNDGVEHRLFEDGNVPENEGWGDSPDIPEPPQSGDPIKRRRGRPRKVIANDDS